MDTLTEALATVKRTVTSRRRSESFDVSLTFTLTPVFKPERPGGGADEHRKTAACEPRND